MVLFIISSLKKGKRMNRTGEEQDSFRTDRIFLDGVDEKLVLTGYYVLLCTMSKANTCASRNSQHVGESKLKKSAKEGLSCRIFGDFRAKYYGKSKGKKPGSVTFRYENNEIINRDGKTGKNHFLNVLDLGFPNGYSMQIIRDTMMPEKVAYSGFGDGKLKFKGKFDKKVKRELYDQMKKQDLINLEGAPGEKDLFNRIAGAINGVFIDSERDKALAGLEKEMEDYNKINESLSRGSLYRKRYFGRY